MVTKIFFHHLKKNFNNSIKLTCHLIHIRRTWYLWYWWSKVWWKYPRNAIGIIASLYRIFEFWHKIIKFSIKTIFWRGLLPWMTALISILFVKLILNWYIASLIRRYFWECCGIFLWSFILIRGLIDLGLV